MARRQTDTRPRLERLSTAWWLTGIAAALAVGLHFAGDLTNPVTAALHLLILSIFAFGLFWIDKRRARKDGARRVSQTLLLAVSALGGAGGGLAAMSIFRHKTKRWSFKLLVPLFLVLHLVLLMWLSGWFDSAG